MPGLLGKAKIPAREGHPTLKDTSAKAVDFMSDSTYTHICPSIYYQAYSLIPGWAREVFCPFQLLSKLEVCNV